VTLQKFDSGLNPDVSEYANETERLKNQLLNQSTAELESLFRDNPELLNGTELEARHEELQDLVAESNNDLEERVAELRDSESIDDAANTSEEQLKRTSQQWNRRSRSLRGNSKPNHPPPKSTVAKSSRNSLRRESQPGRNHGDCELRDRSSEVIDDEYISVESASVLGGDQVVVDGLEIPSDRAVADLEVKGVSTGAHSAPRAIR